ncbi:hypothetical protein TWF730_010150 [Orbilia blumenaviensis]|uniref:Uncharacterized protein n=1 Tax=Orbilia blumenaviensis TaxID=1796055 RepID=A0AAV9UMI5_9PEZI
MQQKLLLLLPILSAAIVNATTLTIQAPITGCEGNAYCTGFQKCGAGHCHRRESCGNWGGKVNACCYAENGTETCRDAAGDFWDTFDLASSGTEAVYAKSCPRGTEAATYDYRVDGFACCPPNSDIIIEVEAQNATFLEPSVPLEDKYQTIVTGRCVGAGFSESSSPSPSSSGTPTGTPTGESTGTTSPNSASSNVPVMLGLSFLALVLGFA